MSRCKELEQMQEHKKLFTEYVDNMRERSGDKKLSDFCIRRQFPLEVVKEAGIFYIEDATEMLVPDYLDHLEEFGIISNTNRRPIFHNRYVIPIYDTDGLVVNLVGYSWEADERYVYGTGKYYRRRDTMYGLDSLELAYDLGYAIITEGITDAIRVRSLGYKNCFAMCGTHDSSYIMKQLNRCRYGVIKIHDRDAAGMRAVKNWKCCRSVQLTTFLLYKDVDEMCTDSEHPNNQNIVKEYIDASIDWLKTKEHRGYHYQLEQLTMSI